MKGEVYGKREPPLQVSSKNQGKPVVVIMGTHVVAENNIARNVTTQKDKI
jgi:hypothetical protein